MNYITPQDRQGLQSVKHTDTPIGVVAIVSFSKPIPPGWDRLDINEAQNILHLLKPLLSQWSIVAFRQGKLDGSGYGYKIHQSYGQECGEGFIIKRGAHL